MLDNTSPWFSPVNVLYYHSKLPREHKAISRRQMRKADEMRDVALSLLGIFKQQKIMHWLNAVSDNEGIPDVRAVRYSVDPQLPKHWEMIDVEHVLYNEYATEDLATFLKRTKLSKSYPPLTTFVCRINCNIIIPTNEQLRASLSDITQINPVYIVGRTTPPNVQRYMVSQIHPVAETVAEFDALEVARQLPADRGVLFLQRNGRIGKTGTTNFPFEDLYIPKELYV